MEGRGDLVRQEEQEPEKVCIVEPPTAWLTREFFWETPTSEASQLRNGTRGIYIPNPLLADAPRGD